MNGHSLAKSQPQRTIICGDCLIQPPPIDSCVTLFSYQPPIQHLIEQFKNGQQQALGRTMSRWLSQELEQTTLFDQSLLLLPVPASKKSYRYRGFNQAAIIGATLSQQLNLPWRPDLLQQTAHVQQQKQLSSGERQANRAQAYHLNSSVSKHLIKDRQLVIIDDVITTGATVFSIARLLKSQGAKSIHAWALARTPKKR